MYDHLLKGIFAVVCLFAAIPSFPFHGGSSVVYIVYFAASRVHYEKGSGIQSRKEKNISSIKEDNSDIYHSLEYIVSVRIWKEGRRTKDPLNERRNRNRCE